jgi:hypothetical protein
LTDGVVQARDGASGSVYSNYTTASPGFFVNPGAADLHLKPTATEAIDRGVFLPLLDTDFDGDTRPAGAAADLGADERVVPGGGAHATFVATDLSRQGDWATGYGADGYAIVGDATRLPSYGTATPRFHQTWTWAASTSDRRALKRAAGADRVAATWYGNTFDIDVDLTDGQPHLIAVYMVDWDSPLRSQRVDVLDAATGTALDSRTASGFAGGQYLVWTIQGHAILRITRQSGANAVVSGVFFGGPVSPGGGANAAFIRADAATQGNWQSGYGHDGYAIVADTASLPGYATVTPAAASTWTWTASTSDARALRRASGADRVAATWYGEQFDLDVNLTDNQPHQIAIYMVDWDSPFRSQLVQVLDAATGTVLDSRAVTSFQGGQYVVWTVQGHVVLRITRQAGANAVVSGIFFGGPA